MTTEGIRATGWVPPELPDGAPTPIFGPGTTKADIEDLRPRGWVPPSLPQEPPSPVYGPGTTKPDLGNMVPGSPTSVPAPSVLPASTTGGATAPQLPTVLPVIRGGQSVQIPTQDVAIPTQTPGRTGYWSQQYSPRSGIGSMQSVTRRPSIVPTQRDSVMKQIAGTATLRQRLTMPSLRPSATGFAQRRRSQGPGIQLTGMKLF